MVCEWGCEDSLAGILDALRQRVHELHDLCAVERQPNKRSYDVSDREAVKDLKVRRLSEWTKDSSVTSDLCRQGKGYSRTPSPTPVTRFAIEPTQVNWG